jgi:hypothetical protein
MCEIAKIINALAPLLAAIAAVAAAIAAFKANEISGALKRLQKNSILNQREVQLLNRALELLKIYEVWCTDNGAGNNVNFHDSKESNYDTRDDAWSQIPRDIKYVLIQLSSHSERLEQLLSEWELGFIEKTADTYTIKAENVKEKIKSLREIVAGGL